jgi:hypothetical protein
LLAWNADEPYGRSDNPGQIHRDGDDNSTTVTYTDPGKKKITVTIPCTNKDDGKDGVTIYAYNAVTPEGGEAIGKWGKTTFTQFVYRKIFIVTATAATACKSWEFLQLKKTYVTATLPGGVETQIFPPAGNDPDAWSIDVPEGIAGPAYPPMNGLKGIDKGTGMIDEPGFPNPWTNLDTGNPNPKGTKLKATYKFRTFILCTNPKPRHSLGCYTWGFSQEIETTGADSAKQTMTPDKCDWHPSNPPDADYTAAQKDFERIVNDKAYPGFMK